MNAKSKGYGKRRAARLKLPDDFIGTVKALLKAPPSPKPTGQHPYKNLEKTREWKTLDRALADLERNRDLVITTSRAHVIGYLCAKLAALEMGG